MKDQSPSEILEIFLKNKLEAENYISLYGDTVKDKNIAVTLSYQNISKMDPLFIWFAAATLGSLQVGKTINLVNMPVLNHCESTSILSNGFSYGNQEIHNNIVALYYTYRGYGIDGLKQLLVIDEKEQYISINALEAFREFSQLEVQAKEYAIANSLSASELSVIKHIFNDSNNLSLLKESSLNLVMHEQSIVQPMYNRIFFENGKTVGETLNDASYIEKLVANKIEIAGAKILDKYISTDGYDFSSYEQRMAYFSKVFDEYFKVLEQTDGFEKLIAQREELIAALDTSFIAYGEHFHEPQNYVESINKTDPATVFTGEYEIVKVNFDPLAYFLEANPNYEVIAHDISELWSSNNYLRTPLNGGTAFWNPKIAYLSNSTYLALYTDGDHHYYQPYGEVRGITFPFIYDKTTGIPLTMPIQDADGHYNHVSTIDTIYNNPSAFNTPSHINWYNPYWNQVLHQAAVEATNQYFKSITIDRFMDSVLAPSIQSFNYNNTSAQLELKFNDVVHNNNGNIDFSNLNSSKIDTWAHQLSGSIASMELANGTLLQFNNSGGAVCVNCNSSISELMESAANVLLHQI